MIERAMINPMMIKRICGIYQMDMNNNYQQILRKDINLWKMEITILHGTSKYIMFQPHFSSWTSNQISMICRTLLIDYVKSPNLINNIRKSENRRNIYLELSNDLKVLDISVSTQKS